LYRIYNLALDYFDIPQEVKDSKTIITIQSRGNKKFLGWFCGDSWKDGDNILSEINMCAEHLNLPLEEIVNVILHELAHKINFTLGIEDCNSVNQYHKKPFKIQAQKLGLKVDTMPGKGCALTSLDEKGLEFFNHCNVNADAFKISRILHTKVKKDNPYIAVTLKKEEWEDRITQLVEEKGFKNAKEAIVHVLCDYFDVDKEEIKEDAA
jgi:hypothetical protein